MTDTKSASVHSAPAAKAAARQAARASRVAKPAACGCGQPVEFDLAKQEFFCIGCGGAKECVCLRSPLSTSVRPIRVA